MIDGWYPSSHRANPRMSPLTFCAAPPPEVAKRGLLGWGLRTAWVGAARAAGSAVRALTSSLLNTLVRWPSTVRQRPRVPGGPAPGTARSAPTLGRARVTDHRPRPRPRSPTHPRPARPGDRPGWRRALSVRPDIGWRRLVEKPRPFTTFLRDRPGPRARAWRVERRSPLKKSGGSIGGSRRCEHRGWRPTLFVAPTKGKS